MVGHVFNERFSKKFVELMEKEIEDLGIAKLFLKRILCMTSETINVICKILCM